MSEKEGEGNDADPFGLTATIRVGDKKEIGTPACASDYVNFSQDVEQLRPEGGMTDYCLHVAAILEKKTDNELQTMVKHAFSVAEAIDGYFRLNYDGDQEQYEDEEDEEISSINSAMKALLQFKSYFSDSAGEVDNKDPGERSSHIRSMSLVYDNITDVMDNNNIDIDDGRLTATTMIIE